MNLPFDDKKMKSKKEYLDDLAVFMGGYVAEKKVYGDITTGPSSDLQRATEIAYNMVTKFGMSDKIGNVTFYTQQIAIDHSPELIRMIDEEVKRIIDEAKERARRVLDEHEKAFYEMSNILALEETFERKEYEELLKRYGIRVKDKKTHLKLNFQIHIPEEIKESVREIIRDLRLKKESFEKRIPEEIKEKI